jgi:hypothetical protein
MEYRLLIDLEAVEIIQRLPRRAREALFTHLEHIREFPSRYSDYHEYDATGRRVEISVHETLAVHFWIDPADRHIKVLALKPSGT